MNKINSIFIANLAEIAGPLARLMNQKNREYEIYEDHVLSDRLLFTDQDNRILITPLPIDSDYIEEVKKLLGFKNFVIFNPKKVGESTCLSIIEDKELLKKLIEIINNNPGIDIIADASTKEFIQLIDYLRNKKLKFRTSELPDKDSQWTIDFFGSKEGFRQAVSQLKNNFPVMPIGFICNRVDETLGWVRFFLKNKKGCILKTNRGLAGAGLKIIRSNDLKNADIDSYILKILNSEPYWTKESVIVEDIVSIDPAIAGGNPSTEFKINEQEILPLYNCGMRVTERGVFKGIEIGKDALPKNINDNLLNWGNIWAKFLQKVGYRGFFDIDMIVGKDGKIYPVESNLRRTGGTFIYEACKRLLGEDFLNNYYIVANNIMRAPRFVGKDYQFVKKQLFPLLYPISGKKEGVILTGISYLVKGNIGYVVIGPDKTRVSQIEQKFLSRLS